MASNLSNPQTSQTGAGQTGSTNASTETGQYIAPVIAAMNADASGNYGVLQRAKVTITNIDQTFNYILSEAQSASLMNLFSVADTDISRNTNVLDSSANVDVNLNLAGLDGDNFRTMIRTALSGALSSTASKYVGSGAAEANLTPSNYLAFQAYSDALKALKYDTLADMLGADDFSSFRMSLDMCGGAISLVDKLTAAEAAIRKTLYTQLPETNTEKYLAPSGRTDLSNGVFAAENVSVINFLPLVVGDKIVFVFDVTVGAATANAQVPGTLNVPSGGPAITRENGDGALVPKNEESASSGAGALVNEANADNYISSGSLTFSAPTRRRIALALMISRHDDSRPNASPLAATDVSFNGEGLIMEFTPQYRAVDASGTILMDPKAENYGFMLAAGILDGATGGVGIKAAVGPVPTGSTSAPASMPVDAVTMDISINHIDISDGSNIKVVTGCGALVGQDAANVYGRFAFIPDNALGARANEFSIVRKANNEWQLDVNAMCVGVSKGKLVYIENGGYKVEKVITVNTNWAAPAP
jgi:hypothetical protein